MKHARIAVLGVFGVVCAGSSAWAQVPTPVDIRLSEVTSLQRVTGGITRIDARKRVGRGFHRVVIDLLPGNNSTQIGNELMVECLNAFRSHPTIFSTLTVRGLEHVPSRRYLRYRSIEHVTRLDLEVATPAVATYDDHSIGGVVRLADIGSGTQGLVDVRSDWNFGSVVLRRANGTDTSFYLLDGRGDFWGSGFAEGMSQSQLMALIHNVVNRVDQVIQILNTERMRGLEGRTPFPSGTPFPSTCRLIHRLSLLVP